MGRFYLKPIDGKSWELRNYNVGVMGIVQEDDDSKFGGGFNGYTIVFNGNLEELDVVVSYKSKQRHDKAVLLNEVLQVLHQIGALIFEQKINGVKMALKSLDRGIDSVLSMEEYGDDIG